MANVSKPMGLKPVAYLDGSPWNGQARLYRIPSTDVTAYYVGHPVTLAGSGDANGVADVAIGVAGSAIVGAIVGIVVAPSPTVSLQGTTIDLTVRSIPATKAKDYYVLVADDPNIIFEMEEGTTAGAAGTAMTAADIGLNANFIVLAGATTYSDSGTLVDNATKATTATLNVKLLGLAQREDNAFGARAKWLVKVNNHVYSGTGTLGL